MAFDSSRPSPSPTRLLHEAPARGSSEASARGFSLRSLSIGIVSALVVGGALTLFALGSLRAGGEALRAVALAAALREAALHSPQLDAESVLAGEACRVLGSAPWDCQSRSGRARLRLESAAIEDGLLRLRWRAEQGGRQVRVEVAIAGNGAR